MSDALAHVTLYGMSWSALRITPRSPIPASALTGDAYLTDGRRLFRVVSALDPRREHPVARLEDCQTLSVSAYSAGELYGMRLRTVIPASSAR
jgi:hypothetical protein